MSMKDPEGWDGFLPVETFRSTPAGCFGRNEWRPSDRRMQGAVTQTGRHFLKSWPSSGIGLAGEADVVEQGICRAASRRPSPVIHRGHLQCVWGNTGGKQSRQRRIGVIV